MTSTASATASKTFRQLFRASKFVSTDPARPGTIYSAALLVKSGSRPGDFGLKRDVPSVNEDHIKIEDYDTEYGFSRVHPVQSEATRYQVYEENFALRQEEQDGDSGDETLAVEKEKPNLYNMSNEEFEKLLEKAKSMREEYKKEIDRFPSRKGSLVFASKMLDVCADTDAGKETFPCSMGYLAEKTETLRDHKVRGRILNRVPGGYAVGIGGVVGLLPSVSAEDFTEFSLNPDDRLKTYDFYLQELKWSRDGRPQLVVSLRRLTEDPSLALAGEGDEKKEGKKNLHSELQSLLNDILSSSTASNSAAPDADQQQQQPKELKAKSFVNRRPIQRREKFNEKDLENSLSDFLASLDNPTKKK